MRRILFRRFSSYRGDPDAHNPFYKTLKGTLEKRSELFPERIAIPGRNPKYFLAFGFLMSMFGWKQWVEVNRIQTWQVGQANKLQRKAVPFIQAMDDIRLVAMEDRVHILIDELFEHESQEFRDNLKSPYFQKDVFVPRRPSVTVQYHGIVEDYMGAYGDSDAARFYPGLDTLTI